MYVCNCSSSLPPPLDNTIMSPLNLIQCSAVRLLPARSALAADGPTLRDFMLQAQARALYRQALRMCFRVRRHAMVVVGGGEKNSVAETNHLSQSTHKDRRGDVDDETWRDLRGWVRGEFRATRNERDPQRVRQLLAQGANTLRDMQKTLELAGRL